MSKIIAFALALSVPAAAPAGYALAAEPVETAISDWVAAIDSVPGWSARYDAVTYDRATDTARLSGLTVNNNTMGVEMVFEPISIVGYSENPDGTFGAESVTTDGATVTGEKLSATIADFELDGLGNVPKNHGTGEIWDPERPFTSMIRAYAPFVDIRLDHSRIGTLALVDKTSGVPATTVYQDLAVDGWADGKIAGATGGPMKVSAAVPEGGAFTMSIGGFEMRGMDYAAMWRVYDPDQYVGGVGDGIWREAVETVTYRDLSFEGPEGSFTIGTMNAEDLKVRQPERSFAAFLDQVLLDPNKDREPTPEEVRTALSLLSAFSVGRMSMRDMDIAGEDSDRGHLESMAFADFSSEGLGEFAIEGMEFTAKDAGFVKLGRIAVGGIVFPDLATLIEAERAKKAGEAFDYSRITFQVGFVEALDLDAEPPDSPRVQLERARLDLANYIGSVPTSMALDVAGLGMQAEAIEDPSARATMQALGYDSVDLGTSLKLAWKEDDGSVVLDDFRFAVTDVGTVSASAVLGNLEREAFADYTKLSEALQTLALVSATLTFTDDSITDRAIGMQATMSGVEPEALRNQIAASIPDLVGGVGNTSLQEQLKTVLELFIMNPGSITATATPSAPVPLVLLAALAQAAPANLPDLLGVTVESAAP